MASTKSLKRQQCSEQEDERVAVGSSLLEALPQEILIKVACWANHEDLRQLIGLSKVIQHAIIARESYFDQTPSETTCSNSDEAPHPPKRLRQMNSIRIGKNMPRVALFVDEEEEKLRW